MKFRIEPDLKYCPECQDEYRPDIERCASCSVVLLTGREVLELEQRRQEKSAGRAAEIQAGEDLVDIRKGKLLDMKQVQYLLARHGVPSLIAGDSQSCGKGCGGADVLLRARREDIEEIITIFRQEHIATTGLAEHDLSLADAVFNPSAGEATCPACGHTFSTQSSTCPDCGLCF
jgi:hypothetical protein